MLRFLFRNEQRIEHFLFSYIDHVADSCTRFQDAMQLYLRQGVCDDFRRLAELTHQSESKADDMRGAIEGMMYEKALLPESRGDILGLLEAVDAIPGIFDRILYTIENRRIQTPDFLQADLLELVRVSVDAVQAFVRQLRSLFNGGEPAQPLIQTIDHDESAVDRMEHRLMRSLFDSACDPFVKLQAKDMLVELSDISDLAHQLSRRVYIISVKRRV